MAALIPGAQFAALAGLLAPIYAEDADAAASMLLSFLRDQAHHLTPDQTDRTAAKVTGGKVTGGTLTAREFQVADLVADGFTNAEIARTLGVSVRTVDAHAEHVRTKLGVRARAQIAVWARLTPNGRTR